MATGWTSLIISRGSKGAVIVVKKILVSIIVSQKDEEIYVEKYAGEVVELGGG